MKRLRTAWIMRKAAKEEEGSVPRANLEGHAKEMRRFYVHRRVMASIVFGMFSYNNLTSKTFQVWKEEPGLGMGCSATRGGG